MRQLLFFFAWTICAPAVFAEQITVAVASNFTGAMQDIAAEFERESGHKVRLAFGSSGKFYAQIKHGAPFQAFFSADQSKPEQLELEALIVPDSRFTYALGALALWSANENLIDEQASILKSGNYNKLAIANPKLAPYGAAALETIRNLKLENSTRNKWVQGENIAQTYQFVGSGNADIGFVALAQIIHDGRLKSGSAWKVPENLHSPIRQDAVMLRKGENSPATRALLQFVQSSKGRKIIERYGYQTEAVANAH